jgi:hypothetical protein
MRLIPGLLSEMLVLPAIYKQQLLHNYWYRGLTIVVRTNPKLYSCNWVSQNILTVTHFPSNSMFMIIQYLFCRASMMTNILGCQKDRGNLIASGRWLKYLDIKQTFKMSVLSYHLSRSIKWGSLKSIYESTSLSKVCSSKLDKLFRLKLAVTLELNICRFFPSYPCVQTNFYSFKEHFCSQ